MATKKTAISRPRGAPLKGDREIATQIDTLFSDEEIVTEQKQAADEFLRLSPLWREKW